MYMYAKGLFLACLTRTDALSLSLHTQLSPHFVMYALGCLLYRSLLREAVVFLATHVGLVCFWKQGASGTNESNRCSRE